MTARLIPEASLGQLKLEIKGVASTKQLWAEATLASYIEFALSCDSAEDYIVHPPHPKEVTFARCTEGVLPL